MPIELLIRSTQTNKGAERKTERKKGFSEAFSGRRQLCSDGVRAATGGNL